MSIWFAQADPEALNRALKNTLGETLNMQVTEIGDDFLRMTMPVNKTTHQPLGLLHGGASMALSESVASLAASLCLDISKQYPVGAEINANHLRSIREGIVTATARPFHIGRRSHVWDIQIRDEQERLICISRMTASILDHS